MTREQRKLDHYRAQDARPLYVNGAERDSSVCNNVFLKMTLLEVDHATDPPLHAWVSTLAESPSREKLRQNCGRRAYLDYTPESGVTTGREERHLIRGVSSRLRN